MHACPVRALGLVAALATTQAALSQVTYVDAVAGGNTTLADGSPFFPNTTTTIGNDGLWSQRVFANGGTIFESNSPTASGGEDCPMLRTTITGLVPGTDYHVFGYLWGGATVTWRLRAMVSTTQPAPQIQGWNSRHSAASVFAPATPLAFNSPIGTSQVSRNLNYDAAGFESSAYFANPVLLQEGNRWLFEAPLGIHTASASGEIVVYADDLEFNGSSSNRTWFDGVGYLPAATQFGSGCGSPATPAIGNGTAPIAGQNFRIELSGAPASSPCAISIGFSNTSWLALPLPLDLGLLGFAGCPLNVSLDVSAPAATDPAGAAGFAVPTAGLGGLTLYWQWIVLTPAGPTPLHATPGLASLFR